MPSANPYSRLIQVDVSPVDETNTSSVTSISALSDGSIDTIGIKFHVEQTILGIPGFSEITFYNLSVDKRALFNQPCLKIVVKVGTETTGLQEIYSGGIINSYTRRVGANFVTTVYCHTFTTQFIQSKDTVTFSAYTALVDILKSLSDNLKAKWDTSRITVPSSMRLGSGGFSYAGQTEDILNKLALQYGFSWTILPNGVFQAMLDGTNFNRNHIVSYRTGNLMTAVPSLEGPFKIMYAVRVQAYLNPSVWAGDFVTLESKINPQLNKDWLIHNLSFDGSTVDNEWTMNLDCKVMNPASGLWGSFK